METEEGARQLEKVALLKSEDWKELAIVGDEEGGVFSKAHFDSSFLKPFQNTQIGSHLLSLPFP